MTAAASAVEAAALSIAPRADGGFVLQNPLTGCGVEVRRAPDGRFVVAGESRLYADAVAARVEPADVAVALDAVEAQVLEPRGRAVVFSSSTRKQEPAARTARARRRV